MTRPDFSAVEVSATPLLGLRGFTVDEGHTDGPPAPLVRAGRGQLRSVFMTRHRWTPGVNVSACAAANLPGARHDGPAKDCMCGFWAYTAGAHQLTVPGYPAFGIIEGWGRMVVGPSGFRAEKARVLALCVPTATAGVVSTTDDGGDISLVVLRADGMAAVRRAMSAMAAITAGVGVAMAQISWGLRASAARQRGEPEPPKPVPPTPRVAAFQPPEEDEFAPACPPDLVRAVRRTYPDVAFFDSVADMVAEFPVSDTGGLIDDPIGDEEEGS